MERVEMVGTGFQDASADLLRLGEPTLPIERGRLLDRLREARRA